MAADTTPELSDEQKARIATVKARLETYDERPWNDVLRECGGPKYHPPPSTR
jgi:hypothetical protein